MKFNLYTIKDELSEFYPGMMPFEEDAQAKRWFRDQVKGNTMMSSNPEDYSIWKTGEINTKTGTVVGLVFPELVERAKGALPNGSSEN